MDPEKLLQQALQAIEAGAEQTAVESHLAIVTDGEFRSISELQARVAPTGPGPSASPEPDPDPTRRFPALRDFLRMAGHGVSLGASPEIAGALGGMGAEDFAGHAARGPVGIGTMVGQGLMERGTPEGQARERSAREDINQIRGERPVQSFLAEMGGGALIPGFGGGGLARAALARGASPLVAGAAAGAGAGATGGAVFGALEGVPPVDDPAGSPGVGGRLAGGLMGGAIGAPLGAGMGATGSLVARALTPLRERALQRARDNYRRTLREAGVPEGEIPARLAALGEGSVPADLADNIGREARAAVNQSAALQRPGGPVRAIEARHGERGERMAERLREAGGFGSRTRAESEELARQNLQAVREQFYRPLEEVHTAITSPSVRAALQHPQVAPMARKTLGRDVDLDEASPSFTELQDIMMDVRDHMTAAQASGRKNRARRAQKGFDVLVDAMEEGVPGFRAAQRAYSAASQRVDAHKLGFKLAMKPPREIREAFSDLHPDAHGSFRQGMLDKFETQLLERTGGGTAFNRIINAGRGMRERLQMLVGGDPELQRLLSGVEAESRWVKTANALRGNSTTAQQAADIHAQMPLSQSGILRSLLARVQSDSPEERVMAAEILGRILLGEGEDAALEAANNLILRQGILTGIGAGVGAGASTLGSVGFPEGVPPDMQVQPDPAGGGLFGGN